MGKSNLKAKLLLSEIFFNKQSSCMKKTKMSTEVPKESR
jgi:hypothetical protein